MKVDSVVLKPPNDGPPMERVWAFVSRDAQGHENVCGVVLGPTGAQPLITGNPRVLEQFKGIAREIALATSNTNDGRTIHLLSFSNREEVEGWQ
jgi:hypothetical protein